MRALIISNPKSGTSETMLGEVLGTIESLYEEIIIKKTREIGDALRFAKESGLFDHLIVIGGDGTLNEVVNGLMTLELEERPTVGIIPAGTCNDFARALELPIQPTQAASIIKSNHEQHVDVIQVDQMYALNFVGVGLIADTSRQIDPDEKESLGSIGYFLATIRQFREADPFQIRLRREDELLYEGDVSFLYVGNGSYLGTVPTKLETQSFSDGMLEVVHSSSIGFPMIRQLLAQQLGLDQKSEEWNHFQTSHVEVELNEPQVIDIDGEHFETDHLSIQIRERALMFLTP
ncbi:diacylglycerol/lipid kinase family protein [Exiguobacterium sp. B2(2022)]|uniref:diacylglycerol/lipid kinase family protein n=1 Tax=Exiguobacterium sp. B2(2022) TaxID=2992755 RepID=UPI00237B228A|nr:diacylglycerol kinase family protein [Exiguobacterium sp. B2(2022)]MDE0564040.1 diacylglycerol kinase family lipid kinase [Exiguobacterium sp. B2(2022)]